MCSIRDAPCQHLISEYADVFKPDFRQHPNVPAKHDVFHLYTQPTYLRPRSQLLLVTINVSHYSTFDPKNSGATFQHMMDSIFGQLPHCLIYMDDLLMFSDNNREHELHLGEVLSLLRENGLIMHPDKFTFVAPTVDFLGHRIRSDGIHPLQSKGNAIQDYPVPTTIKELHAFLGMVNYYYRFIPMAHDHMTPLYNILSGKPKNLTWSTEQQSAFTNTKRILSEAATLTYPQPCTPLLLSTDASNNAIGAVLKPVVNTMPQPLQSYSLTRQSVTISPLIENC